MKPLQRIDLFRGWPAPSLLPSSILLQASEQVLSDHNLATPSLLYGPDPGYQPLREAIATWLSGLYKGEWTVPGRVCITGGASQNLACILQVYADPSYTKSIYMVAPTYYLACRIFEDNGFAGRLRAVPEDVEGVDVTYLEACLVGDELENGWHGQRPMKQPHQNQKHYKNIIYAVPTFSNPSGKTMTLYRRQQLIRLARRYDALIITDDVYDMLRWGSESTTTAPPVLPRLVDIDHTLDSGPATPFGNTVSNGSFSKILGPGVRTGWAEGTPLFIEGLSQCGSSVSGGAPSQLVASIISQTLLSGNLQDHINGVLMPAYRERHRLMLAAIKQNLIGYGAQFDGYDACSEDKGAMMHRGGGFFFYLHLPLAISAKEFARRALQEWNVLVASGDSFEVWGDKESVPCRHGVRICIAWEEPDLLVEGVRRLGLVLRNMLEKEYPLPAGMAGSTIEQI